ncbi:FAD-dependent oxidoreductase [Jatrophihabitans endophyticus]|uniref:FAD-dependent oxidoreductase n=1 Tax=Jatrophihabitans endophyticus TaxID=1206085 RepID=UPI0019F61E32|nr:FAD-dependent oxidoreductase [Jatrophihabitans endophyticus]MBE7187007.1 FAD-dependent oxidoreductase [Jatrophihabitans endophyticus]
MDELIDVAVVGGGAAGLSAAVALARFRRSVVVFDAGDQRNAPAGHVHNFLTRDGTPPGDLYDLGRQELASYGGRIVPSRVDSVSRIDDERFRVTAGDQAFLARRVLFATGSRDELPAVPGLDRQWGRGVLHCPYCHGWEVRGQRIGVLATSPMGVHQALMFRQLSEDVTLIVHEGAAPTGEAADQLAALGIAVAAGPVAEVETADDAVTGVRLGDGTRVPLDAVVVAPFVRARSELLDPLGAEVTQLIIGDVAVATHVAAGPAGTTGVPGVFVAGNVADPMAQVVSSAAGGLAAAGALNNDLITADAAAAAQRHRDHFWSEDAWDERYREHAQRFSGNPNAVLLAEVAGLAPGSAIDVGAGEGADAVWLASRGWRTTAAELSTVALERSVAAAAAAGVEIETLHLDVVRDDVPGSYDLVTSSFVHVPGDARRVLFTRLAAAVAPGGTLLVLGHDLADLQSSVERQHLAEAGWSAEHVAATLGDGWVVDTCEARPRAVRNHDGEQVVVHDAVLRAHRRS